VYAVPDPRTGDQVMCALRMADPMSFDPRAFAAFLDGQPDMGTTWQPRFLRLIGQVPVTATGKTTKTGLRREAWATADPVYWRPGPGSGYQPFGGPERAAVEKEFTEHGRTALLPG
jgi:fatty-acyl-CoA synthase